jgi:endoglycosylceramidase
LSKQVLAFPDGSLELGLLRAMASWQFLWRWDIVHATMLEILMMGGRPLLGTEANGARLRKKQSRLWRLGLLMILGTMLLAVLLTGCGSSKASPSPSRKSSSSIAWPIGPLTVSGRFIVDQTGRVIILHGVNEVYKVPPYCPPDKPWGLQPADAKLMHSLGFDVVRLGYLWEGFEPEKGKWDYKYLDCLQRSESMLAKEHIFTLVDSHQDVYTQEFGGEGFPAWSVHDHHLKPPNPLPPFPHNEYLRVVEAAFDGLWANRGNVWQSYAQAWGKVAAFFAKDKMVLGYDLMNEPWPGKYMEQCANLFGCKAFDQDILEPFETMSAKAIRKASPQHIIFYEPNITFNAGAGNNFTAPPSSLEPIGFSFHDYCLTHGEFNTKPRTAARLNACKFEYNLVQNNALYAGKAINGAPLETEFGATFYVPELEVDVSLSDAHLTGWIYWQFKAAGDITTDSVAHDHRRCPRNSPESLFHDDCDLKTLVRSKAVALAEPYPMAIAGTPTSYGYNFKTHVFHLDYKVNPRVDAPTVVFASKPLHYPHGYKLALSGAKLITKPGSEWIELKNLPGASDVSLTLSPLHT